MKLHSVLAWAQNAWLWRAAAKLLPFMVTVFRPLCCKLEAGGCMVRMGMSLARGYCIRMSSTHAAWCGCPPADTPGPGVQSRQRTHLQHLHDMAAALQAAPTAVTMLPTGRQATLGTHLGSAALGRVAAQAPLIHVSHLQPQQPGSQRHILVCKSARNTRASADAPSMSTQLAGLGFTPQLWLHTQACRDKDVRSSADCLLARGSFSLRQSRAQDVL